MAIPVAAILDRKGRNVVTIQPDATVDEATRLLAEHNIGALVVSQSGDEVEGIISERDIVRQMAEVGGEVGGLTVRDVMTAEVTTCTRDMTSDDLMATMTAGRIRHVPVLQDGKLGGIISIGDVVKSRIDELEIETESLKEYVTGSSY